MHLDTHCKVPGPIPLGSRRWYVGAYLGNWGPRVLPTQVVQSVLALTRTEL